MTKRFIITSAIFGAIGTGLFIFNNVVLTDNCTIKCQSVFNNGILIIYLQTVALASITFMNRYLSRSYLNAIYYIFVIGTIIFSMPLLVNGIRDLTGRIFPNSVATMILGGSLIFIGWITLLLAGLAYKHKKSR